MQCSRFSAKRYYTFPGTDKEADDDKVKISKLIKRNMSVAIFITKIFNQRNLVKMYSEIIPQKGRFGQIFMFYDKVRLVSVRISMVQFGSVRLCLVRLA